MSTTNINEPNENAAIIHPKIITSDNDLNLVFQIVLTWVLTSVVWYVGTNISKPTV